MFRSSPSEVFSKKGLCKHEANPQENNDAEARSQQSRFATLLKSHPRTDKPPKICSTSTEHPPLGEQLWGTASTCQKNLKDINYKNLFLQLLKEIY